ncbi:MAG TPA: hemolysin family protein [Chthonomonadaceae bacterium]|nr:hemolysin family protein [Chthonomonadaceae bacterium]
MSLLGILLALLLVFLNAFFVAAEFAVIKVRATRIEERVREGSRAARVVQHIREHLDSYLSATQLGVTLASLALGWIGEPAVARLIEPLFAGLGKSLSVRASQVIGITVAFTAITYLHIVFGELAPKWLAIRKPDRLSLVIAYPLNIFYHVFFPVIWFLNRTAGFLLRRVGISPASEYEETLSEAELRIALSQSEEEGAITESAGDIADRAFHFGRGKVRDVMTPRPEVAYLSTEWSLSRNLEIVQQTRFARYPLCRHDLDDVIGRVHVRDMLPLVHVANPDDSTPATLLESISQPVLFVPETKALDAMLDDFRSNRMEMAIVQDEYGLTAGVVTLEDVLEEVVGEIQQEFAPPQSEVQAMPDGSYLVDSKITLSRLVREYSVGEEVDGVETIGGYVLSTHTGHPRLGYVTHLGNWQVEVVEMAGRRIRRVRISPIPRLETNEPESTHSQQ